jgi:ribonucleases P/MRP protein subunit RPP40
MIKRTFTVRDKSTILQLYESLVRPHPEYSIQAWKPNFRKDIDLLEGVQRSATKLITAIKDEIFDDRLHYVNLTTLETRRLRGDLIEVFKIFEGLDDLDPHIYFVNLVKQTQEITL